MSSRDLRHFLSSYEESRANFRLLSEQAQLRFSGVRLDSLKVPSKRDPDLTIEALHIPPQHGARGLVVLSSGIHGPEAYVGTAAQRFFLQEVLFAGKVDQKNTGYLILHAINPFGFRYGRRVTENNVDLNRNFAREASLFKTPNAEYERLSHRLNPNSIASYRLTFLIAISLGLLKELLFHRLEALRQSIAGGQYSIPNGILYGGSRFEPQVAMLQNLLEEVSAPYSDVLILDLHSGFGRRGHMHLLPNPPDFKEMVERWKAVFGEYPVEGTSGSDFYAADGDFSTFVSRLLEARKKRTVPMVLEFGTMDSQTVLGGLRSLLRLIRENQAYWRGARSEEEHRKIKRKFLEMFFPSDEAWRIAVMAQVEKHLPQFINRFSELASRSVAFPLD